MSSKCNFWFPHDWSLWETFKQGNIVEKGKYVVGYCLIQQRKCIKCGFVEIKSQEEYI